MRRLAGLLRSLYLVALMRALLCAGAEEDPVLQWNAATLAALKHDTSAPLLVARTLAMLHVAQWRVAARGEAPDALAVATAGYTVARSLLPGHQGEFDALWNAERSAAEAPAGEAATKAIERGREAAQAVLAERENDGSAVQLSYISHSEPGQWRRTPPFFRPPELLCWAEKVRPFAIERHDQFRPKGPPALTSAEWAEAFNEIKELGAKESKTRTPEQAVIAKFWADFSNTETPPGHWNSIAAGLSRERKLTLAENARLFALLNMAEMDAGIAVWDAKYHYNFWRPVTAIPRAAEDGNDATAPDPKWLPLLPTPAHPEYPSGHSGFSGAGAVVLASVFGGDAAEFTAHSDSVPDAERHFHSFRACAAECGLSRIYAGIHYRFSVEDGEAIGRQVAEYVLAKAKSPKE